MTISDEKYTPELGLVFFHSDIEYGEIPASIALQHYPEEIEVYRYLRTQPEFNKEENERFPSKVLPPDLQNMVDMCLEESHYEAAFDLIDNFCNINRYPSEQTLTALLSFLLSPPPIRKNASSYTPVLFQRLHLVLKNLLLKQGPRIFSHIWRFHGGNLNRNQEDSDEEIKKLSEPWNRLHSIVELVEVCAIAEKKNSVERLRHQLLLDFVISILEHDIRSQASPGKGVIFNLLKNESTTRELRKVLFRFFPTLTTILVDSTEKHQETGVDVEKFEYSMLLILQRLLNLIVIQTYTQNKSLQPLTELYLEARSLSTLYLERFLCTLISPSLKLLLADKLLRDLIRDLTSFDIQAKPGIQATLTLLGSTPRDKSPGRIYRHVMLLAMATQGSVDRSIIFVPQTKGIIVGIENEARENVKNKWSIEVDALDKRVGSLLKDAEEYKKKSATWIEMMRILVGAILEE